jgi:dihydrodipicolinate synthase/N-acetylneuraminate lyase
VAKEILRFRGVNIGTVRLPMLPIKDCDIPKVKALYEKIEKYTNESN